MAKLVRYGTYLRELAGQQRWISIRPAGDAPRWLDARTHPGAALLWLLAIVVLFDMLILREAPAGGWRVASGMAALFCGIALLRRGLRAGLVPFFDAFARGLAARSPLAVVIGAAFMLGLLLPVAEPVFGALSAAVAHLDSHSDPYLHALLRQRPGTLLVVLALSTGIAVALGMVRILRGWSLRPLIVVTLVPVLGLTGHLLFDPELARVPALAWHCGALIGGPTTALVILAFGMGSAGAAGSSRPPLPGFGMAALATIVPALGVLVYAMILAETTGVEELLAAPMLPIPGHSLWILLFGTPIMLGTLFMALYLVLRFPLDRRLPRPGSLLTQLAFCLFGLALVNVGVRYSLGPLIDQASGGLAGLIVKPPAAAATSTSAWPIVADLFLAAAFVGAATWQAALAEPTLKVFAELSDTATHGVLRGKHLGRTLAAGAALGAFVGALTLAAGLQLTSLLVAGWLIALALAAAAGEDIAGAAWDGAAMTTGPLTIAVLTAAGAGIARVPWTDAGFGLPAASLLGAALAVIVHGAGARLVARQRNRLRNSGFAIA